MPLYKNKNKKIRKKKSRLDHMFEHSQWIRQKLNLAQIWLINKPPKMVQPIRNSSGNIVFCYCTSIFLENTVV